MGNSGAVPQILLCPEYFVSNRKFKKSCLLKMYFAPKPENLTAGPLTPPGRKTFRNRHQCTSGFVWADSLGPCFDLVTNSSRIYQQRVSVENFLIKIERFSITVM